MFLLLFEECWLEIDSYLILFSVNSPFPLRLQWLLQGHAAENENVCSTGSQLTELAPQSVCSLLQTVFFLLLQTEISAAKRTTCI